MRLKLREYRSRSVKVGFVGDTVPGFPIYKPIKKSRRLLKVLDACDLVVANLESPLTTATSVKDFGSSLCSDPNSVQELKVLNVNVANLANNHIIDRGLAGLEETLNVLKQNGISWLGAGSDQKYASKPFMHEFTEGQIALLAYSYRDLYSPSMASGNSPGPNPLILDEAKRQIASLRNKGYIVCVSYHGGDEFFRIPCPKYRIVLKELARAGANLVIGHHAHVFQGVEVYNGSIIAYGLGNFYMNTKFQMDNRGSDIGLLLTVELDRLGPFAYSLHFVHNQRSKRKLSIVQGQKRAELLKLFKQISDALIDWNKYVDEWRRDCFRMVLGMNDAHNDFWTLRTARRLRFGVYKTALGVYKTALKAFIKRQKINKTSSQLRSNSSILELISAAMMGFPTNVGDFRSLRQCYKAYDMEEDS
jgi:hypothetical protein